MPETMWFTMWFSVKVKRKDKEKGNCTTSNQHHTMKFPHSHYTRGKRVYIRLRDGSRITGKFMERRARFVRLDTAKVATRQIAGMGFDHE